MADPQGVALALGEDWDEVEPVWERIDTLSGCRVVSWQIDRGRPDEFSKTDTGTASIRLVDLEGLFDPMNASSPYAGQIVPGVQAAICLQNPTGAHAWFTMFRGHIESWHYSLGRTREYLEVEIQLADAFARLARHQLRVGVDGALPPYSGSPEAEKLADLAAGNILYGETDGTLADRLNAIRGDAGWPAGLSDFFSGNVRVGPKAYAPGTSALDAMFDCVDAEFPGAANLYVSKEGILTFHGRQPRFRPDVAEYGIQRRTCGDPSAWDFDSTVVPIAELEWVLGGDSLYNSATATPQGINSGTAWRQLDPNLDNVDGQVVTDAASAAAYGLRSVTFDNLQTIEGLATGNTSLQETKLFADYYVENYKAPAPRLSRLVFKSRHPEDAQADPLWNHMCRCEISDLLTVQTEHPGGGMFDDEFYVEGIHMTCRPATADYPIAELALDVSPRAHWTTNPFDADGDPAP